MNLTEATRGCMMLRLEGTNEPAPDRTGMIDHIQERGKSPNRELERPKLRVPKWAPIRRKPWKNRPIRMIDSTEVAGIFSGLGEGWKTAKPLCVGSIPTRASKNQI
jgi:hypothetical protein